MRAFAVFLCFLLHLPALCEAAEGRRPGGEAPPPPQTHASPARGNKAPGFPYVYSNREYWVRGAVTTELNPTKFFTGSLAVGYQVGALAFDLRYTRGQVKFGGIFTGPNEADVAGGAATISSTDTSSELNRLRQVDDPWTLALIEPGVSIYGRMLPDILPQFLQKARVGFAKGTFHDERNNIDFSALVLTMEAAVVMQLGAGSPMALELAPALNLGRLLAEGDGIAAKRRLPTSYFSISLGLQYWF